MSKQASYISEQRLETLMVNRSAGSKISGITVTPARSQIMVELGLSLNVLGLHVMELGFISTRRQSLTTAIEELMIVIHYGYYLQQVLK